MAAIRNPDLGGGDLGGLGVREERVFLPLAYIWLWVSLTSFPEAHVSGAIMLVPNPPVPQAIVAPAGGVPRGLCAQPSISGLPIVLPPGAGSLPVSQNFHFPHLSDESS